MARQQTSSACPDTDIPQGPVRTCVGCRKRAAKRELLRVTVGSDADGRPAVSPDPHGTAPGRGAHVHPTIECYDLAVRRKAFARALRFTAGGAGLTTEPLGELLQRMAAAHHEPSPPTDRNWSSSS
ncbi:YlxR family protein [Nocardioides sp. W7]|uniref:YlxR family protein n=1 Tax=Nocardioides sp. W7 TaxID=2931390 RepID=UPI0024697934|nr:YlxR family protein [Nocardioides sp. W7]